MGSTSTKNTRSKTNDGCRRQHRGLELARVKHQCFRRSDDDTWIVPSATRANSVYVVNVSRPTCTCPDFGENGETCKHLWAVAYVQNKITLLDGTHLAPPPVTRDEDLATINLQGAS
jgi:hypothetical protein